ncbi:MAG: hypothetical protein ACREPB_15500 [Arenimonas sp.]
MPDHERRRLEKERSNELKRELNEDQLIALSSLEQFGWQLKFIRRTLFQPKVAVLYDNDDNTFAILELDGTLNEKVDHLNLR